MLLSTGGATFTSTVGVANKVPFCKPYQTETVEIGGRIYARDKYEPLYQKHKQWWHEIVEPQDRK